MTLALGWGESIGSTSVVGVALSSGAGIGGKGCVFGCGARAAPAAAPLAISRFVMVRSLASVRDRTIGIVQLPAQRIVAREVADFVTQAEQRNLRLLVKVVPGVRQSLRRR
ncbi:hypothetical protein [Methylobacterium soli]|uniref:hypothetical protein n=1 Tax=Methylobacterium soli TaxID=553447 RepID=UPI00177D93CF|nr:hypothetical protein [Methylobacterium soli]